MRLVFDRNSKQTKERIVNTSYNLEGPAKFFAGNKAAHATAVFGAAFSGVLFGVRGVRTQGWQRAGWLALCALQIVQVAGLIRLRRVNVPALKGES
jgi:hypothetical protein